MPSRDDAYLRHQQKLWLRPDGDRGVRPDAARFLALGADVVAAYPVLARKYSASQPRVPAGNGIESGRWTDGSNSGRPRVIIDTTDLGKDATSDAGSGDSGFDFSWLLGSIDFGDIASEIDKLDLFGIKPRQREGGGIRLAGDLPEGESPPEIPKSLPETRQERMKFVRDAARWIAKVGRYSPLADGFFGAADQIEEINRLTDMIRTANDPPRSLEALQDRVGPASERGYHDHHIVGQHVQNRRLFGSARIDSFENKVRIPIVKHLDLNGWYSRPNRDFGNLSPRDYLRNKSWDEQMRVGLVELRRRGMVAP